jgi:hypothetical protein
VFCLLPEPVMPFRGSRYQQTQEFYLNLPPPLPQLNNESFCATSVADDVSRQWAEWPSVCVLDWQSAGRKSRGEIWQLDLFRSINRLFLVSTAADGNPLLLLLQDGLLLDRQQTNNSNSNSSVSNSSSGADSANNYWPEPFRYTLYPFTEFGTVLICGPHFSRLTDRLLQLAGRDNQPPPVNKPSSTAKEFIWCASPIETGGRVVGCFVRMASLDIRLMRGFISREIVEAVEQAAGEDSLFRRQR